MLEVMSGSGDIMKVLSRRDWEMASNIQSMVPMLLILPILWILLTVHIGSGRPWLEYLLPVGLDVYEMIPVR